MRPFAAGPSSTPRALSSNVRTLLALSAGIGLAIAGPAIVNAQSAAVDPAIDVQAFDYAIGPTPFFTVAGADGAPAGRLTFDLLVNAFTDPLVVYESDPQMPERLTGDRTIVVGTVAAGQLTAAYGLTDRIQVGGSVPMIFWLGGDGLNPRTGGPAADALQITGLGDVLLESKFRLLRGRALGMSAIGTVSLPTSIGTGGNLYIGDSLPTARARLAVQYRIGPLELGGNGGVLLRKARKFYDTEVGPQLTWGAASALHVTDRISLVAEAFGRSGFPDDCQRRTGTCFGFDVAPLEVDGGLRVRVARAVTLVLGGGAGLVEGISSPGARFFMSVGFDPDAPRVVVPEGDADGDGVGNRSDACRKVAEDRDGVADADGCPEDDADGDRRLDATDKCPEAAEDLDGFEDFDGCPELDNDEDQIPDLQDKCPKHAEDGVAPSATDGCPAGMRDADGDEVYDDKDRCPTEEEDLDGFEDADGCPEADNDSDGVLDGDDRCAVCPEDKDGFEDGDGCPEPDNDRDGVPDARDTCPAEAEVFNGVKDGDGCADAGAALARLDGDRMVIDAAPAVDRAGKLTKQGAAVVASIAAVMSINSDVTSWLVAVSMPTQREADQLATAIEAELIKLGIAKSALQFGRAVGPRKVAAVVRERGDADAAPSCP